MNCWHCGQSITNCWVQSPPRTNESEITDTDEKSGVMPFFFVSFRFVSLIALPPSNNFPGKERYIRKRHRNKFNGGILTGTIPLVACSLELATDQLVTIWAIPTLLKTEIIMNRDHSIASAKICREKLYFGIVPSKYLIERTLQDIYVFKNIL